MQSYPPGTGRSRALEKPEPHALSAATSAHLDLIRVLAAWAVMWGHPHESGTQTYLGATSLWELYPASSSSVSSRWTSDRDAVTIRSPRRSWSDSRTASTYCISAFYFSSERGWFRRSDGSLTQFILFCAGVIGAATLKFAWLISVFIESKTRLVRERKKDAIPRLDNLEVIFVCGSRFEQRLANNIR